MFKSFRALAVVALSAVLGIAVATANPIHVTINTSALAGTNAQLAFDFIDGGTPPSNSVIITAFSTDGTLGAITITGDVSGTLPGTVTLGDSSFFSEYLQDIALGGWISFTFDTTGIAPDDPFFPDAFSLFLIDPATNLSLVTTTDPTGANALLLYSIGLANPLEVYGADQITITATNAVPEPGTALLVLAGLLIGALFGPPASSRAGHCRNVAKLPLRARATMAR